MLPQKRPKSGARVAWSEHKQAELSFAPPRNADVSVLFADLPRKTRMSKTDRENHLGTQVWPNCGL